MSLGALCELGRTVVERQDRLRKYIYFSLNVIFFMPENEISNSVEVFLVFMLFHYIKASFGLFSQFSLERPKNQIIDKRIYAILKLSDLKSDCIPTLGYLTQL